MEITIKDLYNQNLETQSLVRQNEKHLALLNGAVTTNIRDIAAIQTIQADDHNALASLRGAMETRKKVAGLQRDSLDDMKSEVKGQQEWARDQVLDLTWKVALAVGVLQVVLSVVLSRVL